MRRRTMQTIDCHAAGEPLRVVTSGLPPLPGDSILARRAYMAEHLDHVRRFLMWEPRGHADMYGCIVTPPVSPGAFCGVLFMHNEGYSTMCGHGIIGLVTVLIETGQLPAAEPDSRELEASRRGQQPAIPGGRPGSRTEVSLALDTPAGLVRARASVEGGRVREVTMRNVASFVLDRRVVPVDGLGDVAATVAYGGAFYALVDAPRAGLGERPGPLDRLVEAAAAIKAAVLRAGTIAHPIESGIDGLYGVVMGWPPQRPGADQTSLTVFADREVDRSPCGTCTSAVMAARWADGRLPLGAPFINESLIGTRFSGRLVEEARIGPHRAAVPEVSGSAWITGYHTFVLEPDDPLPDGFLLR
jgi:trans-L-3-hydroxyproline dehydratase